MSQGKSSGSPRYNQKGKIMDTSEDGTVTGSIDVNALDEVEPKTDEAKAQVEALKAQRDAGEQAAAELADARVMEQDKAAQEAAKEAEKADEKSAKETAKAESKSEPPKAPPSHGSKE